MSPCVKVVWFVPPLVSGRAEVRAVARLAPEGVASQVATPVPRPVIEPTAGAQVACEAAVIRPLPLTVKLTQFVVLPNEPTLALTVARVSPPVFDSAASPDIATQAQEPAPR